MKPNPPRKHPSPTWEKLPPFIGPTRPLGSIVSVRFSAEEAVALRSEAHSRGIGYTQLLRELVRDAHCAQPAFSWSFHYTQGGIAGARSGEQK